MRPLSDDLYELDLLLRDLDVDLRDLEVDLLLDLLKNTIKDMSYFFHWTVKDKDDRKGVKYRLHYYSNIR